MAIKIVDFCVKKFHMMRGVMIRCWFTMKTPKIVDLSSEIIFVLGFGAVYWLFDGHELI
jgi:hypothetical protein